jgi:hypothetical protein
MGLCCFCWVFGIGIGFSLLGFFVGFLIGGIFEELVKVFFFFLEMFGWWVSLGFGIVLWSFDFRFEVFVVTFSYRDEWIENFENGKNLIEFSFFPAFVAKKN